MENAQYMNIVHFLISYIRENRKHIPPANFLYDYPEQLDKNYTILISSLEGENYGFWVSALYKEAKALGLEPTNQLIVECIEMIRAEKDKIVNDTRLFIDLLRWCDTWTSPSYNISDYDQNLANFHIGHAIGKIYEMSTPKQTPTNCTPPKEANDSKKNVFKTVSGWATLIAAIINIATGIQALRADPQITEQNSLIAEQNQILSGIWQEMQEYNDKLVPSPTPECTPAPPEQWLST